MFVNDLQRLVLYDVPWHSYVGVLNALEDHRLRHTYQETTLELTTRGLRENRIAKVVGRIVGQVTFELDLPIQSVGSMTLWQVDLRCGIEPDNSFYLTKEPIVRGRLDYDSTKDPSPNLVIEVDGYATTLLDRLEVLAKLDVAEVWQYKKDTFSLFRLSSQGNYRQIDESVELAGVTASIMTRLVERLDAASENDLVRETVQRILQS